MTTDLGIRPIPAHTSEAPHGRGPGGDRGPRPGEPTVDGPLYPVGLVVRGRRCLVVGAGKVAARKVRSLLECGAAVTVVAPRVHPAMSALLEDAAEHPRAWGRLEVERRGYQRGDAAGYRLVVAATGVPDVDAAVFEDAEAAEVWVNAADDPSHCSVVLPAVWRAGAVTVSVSTDGVSPALASWLRTQVAELLGAHVGEVAALLGETRRQLHAEGRSTEAVDWPAVLDGPVPALVAQGRLADARAAVWTVIGARPENC